jgi:hypothetical protein
MTQDKKHIQHGLGGLRSETAGGWSLEQHYLKSEPGSYRAPASMTAPCNAKEVPQPKQMRTKTTAKDKAVKAANTKDLKQRNIK